MSSSPIPSVDAKATQDALASITAAIPSKLSHFTLENGLSVYLREDHSTPIVAVQLWYHVGTSHEPPGHTNLSHLLEHLLFEGSSKLPAGQYSRVIALLGGKANATTHDDATAFDILLPANRLPMALEIMADAMSSATLDQAQFEHEIKSIEDERRLKYENSTYFQHLDRHEALAYAGSPYGVPTFGHALDLSEMQWASVHAWYRTWYLPNNATLVVVGATDLPALRRQVEAHFAAIPRGPLPEKATLRFSGEMRERSQVLEDESPQKAVHLSFNVPSQASANDRTTSSHRVPATRAPDDYLHTARRSNMSTPSEQATATALASLTSTRTVDLRQYQTLQHQVQQWQTPEGTRARFVACAARPMFDLVLRFRAGSSRTAIHRALQHLCCIAWTKAPRCLMPLSSSSSWRGLGRS